MRSRLNSRKLLMAVRIAALALLTFTLSGWTTCTAIVGFDSCLAADSQPHIHSLSPNTIFSNTTPVLLTVNGSNFVAQSQILWNGHAVQTRFLGSTRVQAEITRQTFESFGGTTGNTVLISVESPRSTTVVGCASESSGTLILVIN